MSKTTPVDPVKANSPKAKAAEITTSDGLAKPARTTKLMLIIGLLRRSKGATLAELTSATGWQAHSVRGALAGALRHRGFAIESTKTDGVRRYRITQADADAINPADEATS